MFYNHNGSTYLPLVLYVIEPGTAHFGTVLQIAIVWLAHTLKATLSRAQTDCSLFSVATIVALEVKKYGEYFKARFRVFRVLDFG
jgi:hypothetical protein